MYEGDERTCTLCLDEFVDRVTCVRLSCRHMFHADCYEQFQRVQMSSASAGAVFPDCPNCRAHAPHVIARFPYIAPEDLGTPPPQQHHEDSSDALEVDFPAWPASPCCVVANHPGASTTELVYINEQLSIGAGRMGLIIDPGSWNNLMGDQFARTLINLCGQQNEKVKCEMRPTPLNVGGVGHGAQQCLQDGTFPLAMKREDGTYVTGTLKTPIVANAACPGLLGMGTLQRERAIIDTYNKKIHFVAEGHVELVLPPGSRTFSLEQAPSGHLVLPITDYVEARRCREQQLSSPAPTNLHASTVSEKPGTPSSSHHYQAPVIHGPPPRRSRVQLRDAQASGSSMIEGTQVPGASL